MLTTEDDFQAMLDANPSDSETRLVFADWLQERGDPRAAGYRELGRLRLYPDFVMRTDGVTEGPQCFFGTDRHKIYGDRDRSHEFTILKHEWFLAIKKIRPERDNSWWVYGWDRHELEDRVALAFPQPKPIAPHRSYITRKTAYNRLKGFAGEPSSYQNPYGPRRTDNRSRIAKRLGTRHKWILETIADRTRIESLEEAALSMNMKVKKSLIINKFWTAVTVFIPNRVYYTEDV